MTSEIQKAINFDPSTLSDILGSLSVRLQAGTTITLSYDFQQTPKVDLTLVGSADLQTVLDNYRGKAVFSFMGVEYYFDSGTNHTIQPYGNNSFLYVSNITGLAVIQRFLDLSVKDYHSQPFENQPVTIPDPFSTSTRLIKNSLENYCAVTYDNAGVDSAAPFFPPANSSMTYYQSLTQKALVEKQYVDFSDGKIKNGFLNLSETFVYSSKSVLGNINISYSIDTLNTVVKGNDFNIPNALQVSTLQMDLYRQPYTQEPIQINVPFYSNNSPDPVNINPYKLPDRLLTIAPRIEYSRNRAAFTPLPLKEEPLNKLSYQKRNYIYIPEIKLEACANIPEINTFNVALQASIRYLKEFQCAATGSDEIVNYFFYYTLSPVPNIITETRMKQTVEDSTTFKLGAVSIQSTEDGGDIEEIKRETIGSGGETLKTTYERIGYTRSKPRINGSSSDGLGNFAKQSYSTNADSEKTFLRLEYIPPVQNTLQKSDTIYTYGTLAGVKDEFGSPGRYFSSSTTTGIELIQATKYEVSTVEDQTVESLINGWNAFVVSWNNYINSDDLEDANRLTTLKELLRQAASLNGFGSSVAFGTAQDWIDFSGTGDQNIDPEQDIALYFEDSVSSSGESLWNNLLKALVFTPDEFEDADIISLLNQALDLTCRSIKNKIYRAAYLAGAYYTKEETGTKKVIIASDDQLYGYSGSERAKLSAEITKLTNEYNQINSIIAQPAFTDFNSSLTKFWLMANKGNDYRGSLLSLNDTINNLTTANTNLANSNILKNQNLTDYIDYITDTSALKDSLYTQRNELSGLYTSLYAKNSEIRSLNNQKNINLNQITINTNTSDYLTNIQLVNLNTTKTEILQKLTDISDVTSPIPSHPSSMNSVDLNQRLTDINAEIANTNVAISDLSVDNTNLTNANTAIDIDLANKAIEQAILQTDVTNKLSDISLTETALTNIPFVSYITVSLPSTLYAVPNVSNIETLPYDTNLISLEREQACNLDSASTSDVESRISLESSRIELQDSITVYSSVSVPSLIALQTNLLSITTEVLGTTILSNVNTLRTQLADQQNNIAANRNTVETKNGVQSTLEALVTNNQNNFDYIQAKIDARVAFVSALDTLSSEIASEIDFYVTERDSTIDVALIAKYQAYIDRRNATLITYTTTRNTQITNINSEVSTLQPLTDNIALDSANKQQLEIEIFYLNNAIATSEADLAFREAYLTYYQGRESAYLSAFGSFQEGILNINEEQASLQLAYEQLQYDTKDYLYNFSLSTARCVESKLNGYLSEYLDALSELNSILNEIDSIREDLDSPSYYIIGEAEIKIGDIPEYDYDTGVAILPGDPQEASYRNFLAPVWSDYPVIGKLFVDQEITLVKRQVNYNLVIETVINIVRKGTTITTRTETNTYVGTPPTVTPIFPNYTSTPDFNIPETIKREEEDAISAEAIATLENEISVLEDQIEDLKIERAFASSQLAYEIGVKIRNLETARRNFIRELDNLTTPNIFIPGETITLDNLDNAKRNREFQLKQLQTNIDKIAEDDLCKTFQTPDISERGSKTYEFARTKTELLNAYCSDMTIKSYSNVQVSFTLPMNLDLKPGKTIVLDNIPLVILSVKHIWSVVSGGGFILKSTVSCGLNRGMGLVSQHPLGISLPISPNLYDIIDRSYIT